MITGQINNFPIDNNNPITYNNRTDKPMNLPIEELITALNANTAALRDVLAASGTAPAPVAAAPEPAPEPAPKRTRKATAPVEVVVADEETPEIPETTTPTKVSTAPAKDDTPNVPAPVAPGQPEAGEHVDVDEVIAKINSTLKARMLSGDPDAVKQGFVTLRKKYGVERINELRNEPAKLLAVLAATEKL